MIQVVLVLALVSCVEQSSSRPHQEERPGERTERGPAPPEGSQAFEGRGQGQQPPPLPADNPIWDWDAGGFVPDFAWYGEHSWADVRMRVAGHLAVASRDKARVLAERGDLAGASQAQAQAAELLRGLEVGPSEVASELHAVVFSAALRDAALLSSLARGESPDAGHDGLAGARARYLDLAQQHDAGTSAAMLQRDRERLQADLGALGQQRRDLDLSGFDDFNDRHQLRVRLFEAAFDVADPLGLDARWGYWESVEVARQVSVLDQSLQALGGSPPAALADTPAVWWPSRLAEAERSEDQRAGFTVQGLGLLPTGDSLIDVGAEPGPLAIGSLEELGLDDPMHAAWLAEQAAVLNAALAGDPASVRPLVAALVAHLDALGHGSRYYNIKQARNEAVRQLARAGHPDQALSVLRDNRPLHNQDWACPNREGILLTLEGRLLAEAGETDQALAALDGAIAAAEAFLADVDLAQVAGPHAGPGRTPPLVGGGGPPGQGPGGHGPPDGKGRPGSPGPLPSGAGGGPKPDPGQHPPPP